MLMLNDLCKQDQQPAAVRKAGVGSDKGLFHTRNGSIASSSSSEVIDAGWEPLLSRSIRIAFQPAALAPP